LQRKESGIKIEASAFVKDLVSRLRVTKSFVSFKNANEARSEKRIIESVLI
jgi:hypothetical protein